MPISARLRGALIFSSVLAGTVAVVARADAATHPAAGRTGATFGFHFGRQASRESEPAAKLLVVPLRKPNAQPSPPAELRQFFENPLRLRHMAAASPSPSEPTHAL